MSEAKSGDLQEISQKFNINLKHMKFFYFFIFLLYAFPVSAVTVLESYSTKAGKLEIRQQSEDSYPGVFLAGKKLHQFERRQVWVYAYFRPLGEYGDEIAVVSDCGASYCDFWIVLVDKNKKVTMTEAFGNGNDGPEMKFDGSTLLMNFGEGRRDKKITKIKFLNGKLSSLPSP